MSSPNHDLDFLAEALTSGLAAEPGRDCPQPERFWMAARGRLAPAELASVAEHAARCPDCAHELQGARTVVEELGQLPLPPTVRDPEVALRPAFLDALRKRWRGLGESLSRGPRPALAAALVAAGVLAVVLIPSPGPAPWPQPSQTRIDAAQPILELFIEDGQALSRRELTLSWQALDEARYDAVLMTVNLDEIATARELMSAEWRVSTEHLAPLPDGTVLLFQVEAHRPDGSRIVSRTHRVRLAP